MANIGIFGGSFNPPHLGHLLALKEFQKNTRLDRVLVIPAATPPHKHLTANSPTAEQRLELCRRAFGGLDGVEVLDIELARAGASYTADTLAQLRQSYPHDAFFLLMGTDMLRSFSTWYRPEQICQEATLVVAHRDQDSKEELRQAGAAIERAYGGGVIYLENSYLDYSSSSVRTMLAFDCGEAYVPEKVMDQIRTQALYYSGAELKQLPFERLKEVSLSLHAAKRVPHVIGCSETAVALAERYGENVEDAARAGILHDVTKLLKGGEQLKLCEKYAIMISKLERANPKLLHAKTGATVAGKVFGENSRVCEAIYWHTTGRAAMTTLEKIIYLADYIEPNRNFEGVETLRTLAGKDLDGALRLGLEMSMEQLILRKREIDPNSLAALRFLQERN